MDLTIYRSLLAIDPTTNYPISTNYILSTDGYGDLQWQNILDNISSQSLYLGYLPSTISGFFFIAVSNALFVSSLKKYSLL